MNVSDKIAEWLDEKGITHVFGIIGGGNVPLWDAIARRKKATLVCCHHEQAAAMAAAYYYRTANRLALSLVTTGAGSTNAITGVMAAYMDSIPLLVISGNEASRYMDAPTRVWGVQGYDSSGVARLFTNFLTCRVDASTALVMLENARRMALHPRQGPVWIDIPKDIQNAPV